MYRSRLTSMMTLLALSLLAPIGRAQQSPLTTADLDVRIDKALFDTINAGVKAYNRGDVAGCSRIYQGALIGISPFVGHRPDVAAMTQKALATGEMTSDEISKAFALRAVLDEIRVKVTTKPLWTRLGGEPAVKAVVHAFVAKAAGDPKVDFTRGGKYPIDEAGVAKLEQLLVEQVSSVSGGPLKYTGRDMKSVHAGMMITDAQFNAIAGDLIETLQSFNVPKKETDELVGIIATTRKEMVEGPSSVSPTSLWARLGGQPAVTAVVHAFVAKAASDPNVDFTRGGKYSLDAAGVAHLESLLVEQVSSATGGPMKYSGRAMKPVHQGMAITESQFNAIAGDLIAVLQSFNVPKKEINELVGIIATTKKDIVEIP